MVAVLELPAGAEGTGMLALGPDRAMAERLSLIRRVRCPGCACKRGDASTGTPPARFSVPCGLARENAPLIEADNGVCWCCCCCKGPGVSRADNGSMALALPSLLSYGTVARDRRVLIASLLLRFTMGGNRSSSGS